MPEIQNLAVYCGSKVGRDARFADAARHLGHIMAERNIKLVYGAGNVGLMGVIADAILEKDGHAIGVIPYGLSDKELAHEGLDELHVVDSMHERKEMMVVRSDAMVAIPGGIGTLEEIAEALTWALLGIHQKPCGLWNVGGYYDHLIAFLDHSVEVGFLAPEHRALLHVNDSMEALLDELTAYQAPGVEWRRKPTVEG